MMQVLQDANIPIPAFLTKLWKIVNDPETDHLIGWRQCGNTFIIHNQAQFWYELLPLYFKHNNMSSFVRQLNLYGFHKVSSLENCGLAEKDDVKSIQFHHPYFQRDEPELLKKIKRKPQTSHRNNEVQNVTGSDEVNNALKEVRQLRGRQSTVDSQLSAMKQENSVLWRELALLRQKHVKQQRIVNKLIQFLSTMVQPSSSQRMGVVEQRMPLMLNESPAKKKRLWRTSRSSNDGGPTIHELDSEAEILSPEQLIEEAAMEDDIPLIDSPNSQFAHDSPGSQTLSANSNVESSTSEVTFWDKPDVVTIEHAIELAENEDDSDTLIGSFMSPSMYNVNASDGKTITNDKINLCTSQVSAPSSTPNILVATKNQTPKISDGSDLDLHLDNTQCELDDLKEILDGSRTFDSNTLFGLFNSNELGPEVESDSQKDSSVIDKANPMVSGIEQAPTNNLLDFTELFDEDSQDVVISSDDSSSLSNTQSSSLNTPSISRPEPEFPTA
ncbi:unnamed protein product [Ceutorhynchus assimilis]|uniref:HSF-type DNA-binding domain-containing protein n=1 Tax=Ceutorhynchus assimilis TaxID=467358 RepID=A0A9N9MEN6_9CUCU|nr:unnamed protein product [Ceutorhynchus assimilis]